MTRLKKVGLRDVAREARVSIATVSRVLNDADRIRGETRQRVLDAIARLRYTPNLNARMLAARESRTIGVIVSNLDNPFFLDVYRSLEGEAHRLGYEVVVANTGYRPDRLAASVHLMLGRRVDGIAAIVSEMAPEIQAELKESGIPVVYYDVGGTGRSVLNIRVDYAAGMRQIVELLHDLGHRDFALVTHHTALEPLSVRHGVFLKAMKRYGRHVRHRVVTQADSMEGGERATRNLLGAAARPTAIVCVNDVMAAGALRALRERQLRVPEDVSVTGFDDVALAKYVAPSLTTVHIPREEIGRLALDHLVRRPDASPRGACEREIVLTPALVVRESTGPASPSQS